MKKARSGPKITQQLLAAQLSKPQSFVAKYERGERNLDVVEFIRIAYLLGRDPRDIVSDIVKAAPTLRAVRIRRRPKVKMQ